MRSARNIGAIISWQKTQQVVVAENKELMNRKSFNGRQKQPANEKQPSAQPIKFIVPFTAFFENIIPHVYHTLDSNFFSCGIMLQNTNLDSAT